MFRSLTVPPETMAGVIAYIRKTDNSEREFRNRQLGELGRQETLIQQRMDALMDLLMDGTIEKDEYTRKKNMLREQEVDIRTRKESISGADEKFKDCLIALVSLASEAYDLFKGSNIEKKRVLINHVFSNLILKGGSLCYSLRKPFDQFVKCTDLNKWQCLQSVDNLSQPYLHC
ncbi:MAG: hypothetical protein IAE63_00020 [Alphaproteobacteria bacterium]|nr:hypothetical protein [Alphaproteobacteria bacterium]